MIRLCSALNVQLCAASCQCQFIRLVSSFVAWRRRRRREIWRAAAGRVVALRRSLSSILTSPRLRPKTIIRFPSVLLALFLLRLLLAAVSRPSLAVRSPFVARDAPGPARHHPGSPGRRSGTFRPAALALYLLMERAPDMQLWFNLIFASDTDRVLDGRWPSESAAAGTKSKLAFGFDRGHDVDAAGRR